MIRWVNIVLKTDLSLGFPFRHRICVIPWRSVWHPNLSGEKTLFRLEGNYISKNSTSANLFMGHHEKIWLQQYDGPAIYFYSRYVGETFYLFNNEKDALEFFTMETEVNNKLPFLDVLSDNNYPPSLVASVFRKSTYTGLIANFLCFAPFSYKLGLIQTLVDRTFKINSTWLGFHDNIKELTNILGKNQFPSSLVNRNCPSIRPQILCLHFARFPSNHL